MKYVGKCLNKTTSCKQMNIYFKLLQGYLLHHCFQHQINCLHLYSHYNSDKQRSILLVSDVFILVLCFVSIVFLHNKTQFHFGSQKVNACNNIWSNKRYSCYNVKYLDVIFNYNRFIIDLSAHFPSIEGITYLTLSKTRYFEM